MKPNIGLKTPHINNCSPITKPKWEIEIFRSALKSKKNNPNVCLIPRETITTSDAAIKVIKAFFVLKNFSETQFIVNNENKNSSKKKWVRNDDNANIFSSDNDKLITLEMEKTPTNQPGKDIINGTKF